MKNDTQLNSGYYEPLEISATKGKHYLNLFKMKRTGMFIMLFTVFLVVLGLYFYFQSEDTVDLPPLSNVPNNEVFTQKKLVAISAHSQIEKALANGYREGTDFVVSDVALGTTVFSRDGIVIEIGTDYIVVMSGEASGNIPVKTSSKILFKQNYSSFPVLSSLSQVRIGDYVSYKPDRDEIMIIRELDE